MSWEQLEQVVAARVLLDAFETSDRLRRLGVRHALVGGLAVGHHGHPRATKDVDFIVGDEAFAKTEPLLVFREELADVARWGVVDLLSTTGDPPLQAALALPAEGEVPIIGVPELVLMKLRASRPQDLADVAQLVRAGGDVGAVLALLRAAAPDLVAAFSAIVQRA